MHKTLVRLNWLMDLETKIDAFGVIAILFFGSVIGGGAMYTAMDARFEQVNQKIGDIDNNEKVLYVNSSTRTSLSDLFESVDQSVVSINAVGSSNAQGSGFIYSKKGYVVTNHHVIEGSDKVQVTFTDGITKNADIVGTDVYTDLAVLKVDKENLRPLKLANSSRVDVGERAIAIGNPFGLRSSMTSGIISQKGRLLRVEGGFSIPNVLQTDAAINPGNSGGPLINSRGEVVGVNTAIETTTGTFSGIGFAIPANTVSRVVPELINDGEYDHPWIGIEGRSITPELAEAMNLEENKGFLVMDVVEESPAAEAGVQPGGVEVKIRGRDVTLGGDVIVGIGGKEVRDITDILTYLARDAEVGETIDLTVLRDGREVNVPLTLSKRPQD